MHVQCQHSPIEPDQHVHIRVTLPSERFLGTLCDALTQSLLHPPLTNLKYPKEQTTFPCLGMDQINGSVAEQTQGPGFSAQNSGKKNPSTSKGRKVCLRAGWPANVAHLGSNMVSDPVEVAGS